MFHQLLKAPLRVYMISILHQAYMDFTMLEYIAYNPRLVPLSIPMIFLPSRLLFIIYLRFMNAMSFPLSIKLLSSFAYYNKKKV